MIALRRCATPSLRAFALRQRCELLCTRMTLVDAFWQMAELLAQSFASAGVFGYRDADGLVSPCCVGAHVAAARHGGALR